MTKKILLCILDGLGIGEPKDDNAIFLAKTPTFDHIFSNYPTSQLLTHGKQVGLPDNQMGNSEVGHMTIAAGRIIEQDLVAINHFINNGFEKSPLVQNLLSHHKNTGALNIVSLVSNGGVHSHIDHLKFMINFFGKQNIAVNLHLITDGRDTLPNSANGFITEICSLVESYNLIKIATIAGRFYAMDRDNRWERTNEFYNVLIGNGLRVASSELTKLINDNYHNGISDEFFQPTIIGDYPGLKNGDSFLMLNFRSDRVKQISQKLFDSKPVEFYSILSITDGIHPSYKSLIQRAKITDSLGQIIANNNLTQLRIAETEKYAHVTYFFNTGIEKPYEGEERILIPSPKVKTYDLMPEMSAPELSKQLCQNIAQEKFDLIIANFANADMVGHTGNLEATIKAIETLDQCLKQILDSVIKHNYIMILTADHGNAEDMRTSHNCPLTSHTKNPVPFSIINYNQIQLNNGTLADVAPTILNILGIEVPSSMTGKNLIKNDHKKI